MVIPLEIASDREHPAHHCATDQAAGSAFAGAKKLSGLLPGPTSHGWNWTPQPTDGPSSLAVYIYIYIKNISYLCPHLLVHLLLHLHLSLWLSIYRSIDQPTNQPTKQSINQSQYIYGYHHAKAFLCKTDLYKGFCVWKMFYVKASL